MLKLANIIYCSDLVNHTKQEYINYYQNIDNISIINFNLPTLIVGWQCLKSINKDQNLYNNISILDKLIIKNKLYWEFSFEENKSNHIDGVESFMFNVPYYYFDSNVEYILIDPIFNQIKDFDTLVTYIPKNIDKIYNFKNEMMFILSNNKIYGIDLKMFEFFKFDIVKLLEIIKDKSLFVIDDIDGKKYEYYYQYFYFYVNLIRYIVLME
jgi:hypothetical protein